VLLLVLRRQLALVPLLVLRQLAQMSFLHKQLRLRRLVHFLLRQVMGQRLPLVFPVVLAVPGLVPIQEQRRVREQGRQQLVPVPIQLGQGQKLRHKQQRLQLIQQQD
jgi:hypothetical protein